MTLLAVFPSVNSTFSDMSTLFILSERDDNLLESLFILWSLFLLVILQGVECSSDDNLFLKTFSSEILLDNLFSLPITQILFLIGQFS